MYIKLVEFADQPVGTGINGSDIVFPFKERYYEKYDIFMILGSRQQVIVTSRPVRKADNYWEVTGRLIDNDYSQILDTTHTNIGDVTRFQSTAHPEMSEEGYIKYQSRINAAPFSSNTNRTKFFNCWEVITNQQRCFGIVQVFLQSTRRTFNDQLQKSVGFNYPKQKLTYKSINEIHCLLDT